MTSPASLRSSSSLRARPPRIGVIHRHGQELAGLSALVLLLGTWVGSPYLQPRWTLWLGAALLGLGLAGGCALREAAARRVALTVSALCVIGLLIDGLGAENPGQLRWPQITGVVLLGLGLFAGPLTARPPIERGPSPRGRVRLTYRSLLPAVALATIAVLLGTLAGSPHLQPSWSLWGGAALLGLGLGAARLIAGPARRLAVPVASLCALVAVLRGAAHHQIGVSRLPFSISAGLLLAGLVAAALVELSGRSGEALLTARVDELSRTRRGALDAQASELRRIERDLHDGAQARLVALSMKLGRAEDRYRDDPSTAALLREAREDASAAIRELRELARGIAPPILSDRGLEAAARSLAERSGAEVTVSGRLARRPPASVETAAYFVIAESLTNAAKHAPGARVEVRIEEHAGDLFVEVTDFGSGGADARGGGLTGLRQRVQALDGALHVTSPAGVGTQVEAVLPCGW